MASLSLVTHSSPSTFRSVLEEEFKGDQISEIRNSFILGILVNLDVIYLKYHLLTISLDKKLVSAFLMTPPHFMVRRVKNHHFLSSHLFHR